MYLFFANISSQNDRNDLSRNKLKSIFKFQYSTLPIETILALLNNVFVLVCTIQKVTHRAITIASHVFFESLQDCVLFHVKAITGLLCEWGFVRRNFLARFRSSRTTWRPFWRYDWQRQQLDWLKGQRSELYFRMFIVKFSYNDYERNKMYRLSPTFFFKTWTWRRFTTRFTRERGRTWKNSVTPYWGSGLAKTTWRPCWRDRLTVCPEGDLADWLLGQKWGHEWDDTLSWYLGKLISSFDKRLFSFQVYIWYLYKNRPICIWGIIL